MKRKEHSAPPKEVLDEFNNGTSNARERVIRIWDLLGELEEPELDVPSQEAARADLEARIDRLSRKRAKAFDRRPQGRSRVVRSRIFALSATLGFVAVCLWGYLQTPVERVAYPGQQLSVSLPDGSSALLKSGGRLTYDRKLGAAWFRGSTARSVSLDGEAFFQVEPGDRPFEVETFNAIITVLGTGFNVRSYSNDAEQETLVTLEHGRVQVDNLGQQSTGQILEKPGTSMRVKEGRLENHTELQDKYPLDLVTAWKNNGFVAIGLSLESLVKEIERTYGLEIQISNDLQIQPADLIYAKASPDIKELLNDLCLSQSCRFQQNGSGYTLLPAK